MAKKRNVNSVVKYIDLSHDRRIYFVRGADRVRGTVYLKLTSCGMTALYTRFRHVWEETDAPLPENAANRHFDGDSGTLRAGLDECLAFAEAMQEISGGVWLAEVQE